MIMAHQGSKASESSRSGLFGRFKREFGEILPNGMVFFLKPVVCRRLSGDRHPVAALNNHRNDAVRVAVVVGGAAGRFNAEQNKRLSCKQEKGHTSSIERFLTRFYLPRHQREQAGRKQSKEPSRLTKMVYRLLFGCTCC